MEVVLSISLVVNAGLIATAVALFRRKAETQIREVEKVVEREVEKVVHVPVANAYLGSGLFSAPRVRI